MANGVDTNGLSTVPISTSIVVNGPDGTGQQMTDDFATQLAGSGAIADSLVEIKANASSQKADLDALSLSTSATELAINDRVGAVELAQSTNQIVELNWADLSARTPNVIGQGAEIPDGIVGDHADPLSTDIVPDAGRYRGYALTPGAWARIGDPFASSAATKTDVVAETARASGEEQELMLLVSYLRQSLINHGGTPTFEMPPDFVFPIYGSAKQLAAFEYNSAGRYVVGGRAVGTKEALLAQAGLTATADALSTVAPWIAPDRFVGITNQEADTEISPWAASTGATVVWSADNGGQFVFDAGGTNQAIVKQKMLPDDGSLAGLCLAVSGTAARGTSVNSMQFAGSTYASHFGGNNVSSPTISTADLTTPERPAYLSTAAGTQAYVGLKNTSASGSGTIIIPEFDIREARPFEAFPSGGWDAYFEFDVPTAPSADITIFDGYGDPSWKVHSRVTLTYQLSDGHVYLALRVNNGATATLDLGAAVAGQANVITMRMTNANHAASLNGADLVRATSGKWAVGISGFDTAPETTRVAFFETESSDAWLVNTAGGVVVEPIWTEGDSGLSAYGVKLYELLETTTGISVINSAVGGSTQTEIADRIVATVEANPEARNRTLFVFDLSDNGGSTVEAWLANVTRIKNALGHENWVYVTPLTSRRADRSIVTTPSDYNLRMKEYLSAGITEFGGHHFYTTLWEDLQALADGSTEDANDVASGVIPGSLFYTGDGGATYDNTHLGLVAAQAIADGVAPLIANVRELTVP